jgi:hypothetical protein
VHIDVAKANQAALILSTTSPLTYNQTEMMSVSGGTTNGTVTYASSALCSVTGNMLQALSGTGSCSVTATMAGDSNYNDITSTPANTVNLQKANQAALTLNTTSPLTYNLTETMSVSGGTTNGTVTYASSALCSVTGNMLQALSGTGSCSVTATMAGNNNYNDVTSTPANTVSLAKANQGTVTVTGPSSVTYGATGTAMATGGNGTGAYNFTAGGTGGCSLTGITVSVLNASLTCSLTAIRFGDSNYNDSAASLTFQVTLNRANQTITWNAPPSMTFGTPLSSTQLNATVAGIAGGTSPGALTYSPAAGTILSAGSNTLTVNAAATTNYNTAMATTTILVQYLATGLCFGDAGHQILQPINANGTSVFNGKSTSPAKFRVCDANGVSIGTPGVVSTFGIYQIVSGTATTVNEDVASTTPDTMFRWDPTAQQWIFNINNKSYPSNQTYYFQIKLNDGSSILFGYGLK